MVLCKFFLQGNCRFGENCKFEHQLNGRPQHTSIMRQQNFTPNSNTNTIDINTLIRAVTNDMTTAEKGNQWLLSCYAPFKEKPNFPGFNEQSFEEVRWGYYEAKITGTLNQYNHQLQMALQEAIAQVRALQNPSPEAVNTIRSIYNTTPGSSSVFGNSATNPFGNTQNSVFGGNSNVFGQSSNFGNSSNTFGQKNSQQNSAGQSIFAMANQKLFGGAQPGQQQSASIFSNSFNVQPSPFGGGQQTQTSIFNTQQQQQTFNSQPSHPFTVQPQTNSIFNTPANTFAPQQQTGTSIFATQQPQQQINNSPFNTTKQQQPFVATPQNAQPSTPFSFNTQLNSQQPAPFGNQTNVFANAIQKIQASNNAGSNSNSIFGSNNQTVISNTLLPNDLDESVYSKWDELSETDIKSYESECFEFGKIPEKPPTIQMCF